MQPDTTQHISNTSLITGFSIMILLLTGLMVSSIFVLEKDIFRQDEIWMEFLEYGTRFITTRDTIRTMPLSDEEHHLLASLDKVISRIGPLQADIAEKLQHGRREKGIELVLTRANELQRQAFAVLTKFNVLQEKSATNSLTVAHADYNRSLRFLVIIGSSLIIISIVISIYVTLHSIAEGVISTNSQGRIEQLNPNAVLLLAREKNQVLHQPVDEIFLVRDEYGRYGLLRSQGSRAQPCT